MTTAPALDHDTAWTAFEARDRAWDGRFVVGVKTTGIYCKPSCPARHPKRENVTFHPDPPSARAAGFRACLRCTPDEVGRDRTAVAAAVALLEAAEDRLSLDAVAATVGYAPYHSTAYSNAPPASPPPLTRVRSAPDARPTPYRRIRP